MTKKSFLMVITSLLISGSGLSACSANNPYTASKASLQSTEKVIDVGKGKKGASITFKININSFKIKFQGPPPTTADGQAPKTLADDVDHFVVDLISSDASTDYVSNDTDKNPTTDSVISFDPISKDTTSVTFDNVGDSGTNYYYAAVRAVDSQSNDIIEVNAALSGNQRIAVSSGDGVQVDGNNVLTPCCFDLPVTINLDDAVGAKIGSDLNVFPGSNTLDPFSVQ